MPPKRKALESSDPNVVAGRPNAKKAKPGAPVQATSDELLAQDILLQSTIKRREQRWSKVSASKNLDTCYLTEMKDPSHAYEFMCLCNPFQHRDDDDGSDDEGDSEDDDGADGNETSNKQVCDRGKTCPCTKTAASLPSHPYALTRAGMARYHMAGNMANLRNPDAFNMHTYNDHAAYGVMEVVQNMMLDFNEAFKGQQPGEAWAIVEGMALFMLLGAGGDMYMADDGDGVRQTAAQIARMALTALSMLNDKGQFADGTDVRNLGWMLGLYQRMAESMRESGVMDDAQPSSSDTFKFRADDLDLYLQSYTKHFGVRVPGAADSSEGGDSEEVTMPNLNGDDPWNWVKSFSGFQQQHATPDFGLSRVDTFTLGGDKLDISTWSSAERKRHAFDNKDPLPRNLVKKLKEGLALVLA